MRRHRSRPRRHGHRMQCQCQHRHHLNQCCDDRRHHHQVDVRALGPLLLRCARPQWTTPLQHLQGFSFQLRSRILTPSYLQPWHRWRLRLLHPQLLCVFSLVSAGGERISIAEAQCGERPLSPLLNTVLAERLKALGVALNWASYLVARFALQQNGLQFRMVSSTVLLSPGASAAADFIQRRQDGRTFKTVVGAAPFLFDPLWTLRLGSGRREVPWSWLFSTSCVFAWGENRRDR